jgi:hypothetical protein
VVWFVPWTCVLLADPQYAGELRLSLLHDGAGRTRWRVLREDGDGYLLGLGGWSAAGPAEDAFVMGVERVADGW